LRVTPHVNLVLTPPPHDITKPVTSILNPDIRCRRAGSLTLRLLWLRSQRIGVLVQPRVGLGLLVKRQAPGSGHSVLTLNQGWNTS
jgi:hypothetical protein